MGLLSMAETTVEASIKTPTRTSPNGIYVYHNTEAKVSLGVELADGVVTAALAVCNPKDQFDKKVAQEVLRRRLRFKRPNRWSVFSLGDYGGDSFKNDVFIPSMALVRKQAQQCVELGRTNGDLKSNLLILRGVLQENR